MGRYTGAVCKLCRREGMKLHLKGDRCHTDKCSFDRRSFAPGQHGSSRGKVSEYALQLREKQKVKRIYGVYEQQFRRMFKEADRRKGVTGDNLLSLLESRLDNAVFRLGFAHSRAEARVLVSQGHFKINGVKTDISSYQLNENDVIEVVDKSKKSSKFVDTLASMERRGVPEWLTLEKDTLKGSLNRMPRRDDITVPIEEHLVIELYSKV